MLKRTATTLLLCLAVAAPAQAEAPAATSRALAADAPLRLDPRLPAESSTGAYTVLALREALQPAPPAQSGHHPLRTLAIVLGIVIAAVLVAAVYLGHHN
jgi:hypothetical protein